MINELFQVPEKLSPGQESWLQMVASIPGVKSAMGAEITQLDIELSEEARKILEAKNNDID